MIVFFTDGRRELSHRLPALRRALAPAGALWVAWPKKASGRSTDVTFEVVQGVGLALGLVDNKICALDEVWSALRFVVPRAQRDRLPGK